MTFKPSRDRKIKGHNLLEVIVATGVFVVISVALSGVWMMYGRALAKSGEHTAANHLARGFTEGLMANGFSWLETQVDSNLVPQEENYTIVRMVRGRSANISYNILYDLELNTDPDPTNGTEDRPLMPYASEDICKITVTVRWRSANGKEEIEGGRYNNSVRYSSFVYKDAI